MLCAAVDVLNKWGEEMSRLIRYDDAIERLGAHLMANAQIDWGGTASTDIEEWKELADMILNGVPTIDAVSVVHGEWKPFDLTWSRSLYTCAVCGEVEYMPCDAFNGKPLFKFCPYCGAMMKGADDENV